MSRRPGHDESGFTLVELLVTAMIVPIVVTVVVSLLISAMRVNADVNDRNHASSSAQVIAADITRSSRQAVSIRVLTPTPGATMLVERTPDSSRSATLAPTPTATGTALKMFCRAWYLRGGVLWSRWSSTAIAVPTDPGRQGWSRIADGVTTDAAGTPVFAASFPSVALSFTIDGDADAAFISSTVISRAPAIPGSAPCHA